MSNHGEPFDAARIAYEAGQADGYTTGYSAAMEDGWGEPGHIKEAVAATLDAARAAVVAVEGGYSVPLGMPVGLFINAMRREYLAAIDALKESND